MNTPIVHICFDTETAALGERAALLSIAARPFLMPSDGVQLNEDTDITTYPVFRANINATSCVMAGMCFDMQTVRFWSDKPVEAKVQFVDYPAVSIREAIESFIAYVSDIKSVFGCEVRLWCQGTDFDVPKLRYCCTELLQRDERTLPWRYHQVCDARTYILENLSLLFGRKEGNKAIYADIPEPEEPWVMHDALADVNRTIWNVQQVNRMLSERLK